VDDWSIGWRDFRNFLLDWQPAVGLPELFDYHQIPGSNGQASEGNYPKMARHGQAILFQVGEL